MEGYLSTVLEEASLRKAECTEPFSTVYFGGGTPSLIPAELFFSFVRKLKAVLPLDAVCEWTAEANPGTVSDSWLDAALASGINRLSVGMQAAQSGILSLLGRIHRPEDVQRSVRLARAAGFQNISLDLMFGIPNQTMQDWQETLEAALSLSPEHLSVYGLIPEEGTPLKQDLDSGLLTLPDPDTERDMYDLAIVKLKADGFIQYEISNFARPGFACRHNLGYWRQVPYLGLGLSAASMTCPEGRSLPFACIRRTNPVGFEAYEDIVRHPDHVSRACDITVVSGFDACFETMMLGLRLTEGVDDSFFQSLHGLSVQECFGTRLTGPMSAGLLLHEKNRWRLSRRGMDVQNSVLVELL